jgi:hypothetical protein
MVVVIAGFECMDRSGSKICKVFEYRALFCYHKYCIS